MPIPRWHNKQMGTQPLLHRARVTTTLLFLVCWCIFNISSAWGHDFLPESSEMPGWQMIDKTYQYGPQNLYEYINGEAESFLAYGFVSLKGANYSAGPDGSNSMTVDIYDMGEKLNAFGMFQSKRGREASTLNIGSASFGTNGYVVFYKDRYFVEILSFVESEQWKKHHVSIAQSVAEKIPGDISPPLELSYFPGAGRIQGSERYIRGGILGHAFLDRGIISDYSIDSQVVSAFVAFFASREEAKSSFEAHKGFLEKSGETCLPVNEFGQHGFVSQEPYHKTILVVHEASFVIGVYDLLTAREGIGLLKDILSRMKALGCST